MQVCSRHSLEPRGIEGESCSLPPTRASASCRRISHVCIRLCSLSTNMAPEVGVGIFPATSTLRIHFPCEVLFLVEVTLQSRVAMVNQQAQEKTYQPASGVGVLVRPQDGETFMLSVCLHRYAGAFRAFTASNVAGFSRTCMYSYSSRY